jgi:predicted ester cyclase
MSNAEEIKAVQRRLFAEFFSQGKLEVADEIFAPDHLYHNPDTPEGIRGPQGMKQFVVGTFRGAFPDLQGTTEDQIAEGEKVVMRWTARRGTHQGELQSIAPTGKGVKVAGMVISRSAEGKLVESWEVYDTLSMMRQLGLVVIPGPRLLVRMLVGQAKKLGARLPKGR